MSDVLFSGWSFDPCDGLDSGIAYEVNLLRKHGVDTDESCQGGQGHVYPEATICFRGGPGEGPRAFGIARLLGLNVTGLRRYWTVEDGELVGPQWAMTFGGPERNPIFMEKPDGNHTWEWR